MKIGNKIQNICSILVSCEPSEGVCYQLQNGTEIYVAPKKRNNGIVLLLVVITVGRVFGKEDSKLQVKSHILRVQV